MQPYRTPQPMVGEISGLGFLGPSDNASLPDYRAAFQNRFDWVDAQHDRQVAEVGDREYQEIALLAGLEGAALAEQADGRGAVDGSGGEGLGGLHGVERAR